MKTIGARSAQVAGIYLGMVALLGALALALGVPRSAMLGSARPSEPWIRLGRP